MPASAGGDSLLYEEHGMANCWLHEGNFYYRSLYLWLVVVFFSFQEDNLSTKDKIFAP